MKTITYTIEFNPATGSSRPWEVYVSTETKAREFCSSSATLSGAEKSRKGYAAPRSKSFNVFTPEYKE